jgi:hypothetical protein
MIINNNSNAREPLYYIILLLFKMTATMRARAPEDEVRGYPGAIQHISLFFVLIVHYLFHLFAPVSSSPPRQLR